MINPCSGFTEERYKFHYLYKIFKDGPLRRLRYVVYGKNLSMLNTSNAINLIIMVNLNHILNHIHHPKN